MSPVYCSINNCHYWAEGNACAAQDIMVTSDVMGSIKGNNVDAPYHAQFPATPVAKCMESCCKTFVAKGSFEQFEDGVKKNS